MAHMGAAGTAAMNQGGWFSTISDVLDKLTSLPGQVAEMMAKAGWMKPFMEKMAAGVWSNIAGFINKKVPGSPIPATFDNGGTLGKGLNLVNNATGAPERLVRADRQQQAPIYLTVEIGGKEIGKAVIDPLRREIKNISGGNVQLALGRGN